MRRSEQKGHDTKETIPTFSAFILPDKEVETAANGYGAAIGNCWDGEENSASFRVRMTIEADVRPVNMVRVGGRWCLSFVVGIDGSDEWTFATEVGDGGSLSFEEAANRLVGA
jgi:hypothetical protein